MDDTRLQAIANTSALARARPWMRLRSTVRPLMLLASAGSSSRRLGSKESAMGLSIFRAGIVLCMGGLSAIAVGAEQLPTSGIEGWYTPAQATAGKQAYATECASCHGATLQGGAGPALMGESFESKWNGHPLRDLWTVVHDQMPLSSPASLPQDDYINIVAYLFSSNGFQSGSNPLDLSELNRAISPPQSGKNVD
jgi:mono/diheme cytochrome c family protein